MANVRVKTGSEGPQYDPYGFVEVEWTRTDGVEVVYHGGLGEWCRVEFPGAARIKEFEWSNEAAADAFEQLAGVSVEQAQRVHDRLHPHFDDPMGRLSDYE